MPRWHTGEREVGRRIRVKVLFEAECLSMLPGLTVCHPQSIAAVSSVQLTAFCCIEEDYQPYQCPTELNTFESGLHGYKQSQDDDIEWTRHFGPAQTAKTGPQGGDHTTGTGAYMYVESSYRKQRSAGDAAQLLSPAYKLVRSTEDCTLTFWYLMNGKGVGSMKVHVKRLMTNHIVSVFNRTGHQGAQWRRAEVDLSKIRPGWIKIIFIGAVNSERNVFLDIAIDDIQLSPGCCDATFRSTTASASPSTRPTTRPTTLTSSYPYTSTGGISSVPSSPQPYDNQYTETTTLPTGTTAVARHLSNTSLILGIAVPIAVILLIAIIYVVVKVAGCNSKNGETQHTRQVDEEVALEDTADISSNHGTATEEAVV